MDALFAKMKDYVKMDTEITAEEFQAYYKQVIDRLQEGFDAMAEDTLLQGKIITTIMSSNAGVRGKRKNNDAKKFRKMQEKSKFWTDAIDYRLKKMGLSESDIEERTAALDKEMQ